VAVEIESIGPEAGPVQYAGKSVEPPVRNGGAVDKQHRRSVGRTVAAGPGDAIPQPDPVDPGCVSRTRTRFHRPDPDGPATSRTAVSGRAAESAPASVR